MSQKQKTQGYHQRPSVSSQSSNLQPPDAGVKKRSIEADKTRYPGEQLYKDLLKMVREGSPAEKGKEILDNHVFIHWARNPDGEHTHVIPTIFNAIFQHGIASGSSKLLECILNRRYSLGLRFRASLVHHLKKGGTPTLAQVMVYSGPSEGLHAHDKRASSMLELFLNAAHSVWDDQGSADKYPGSQPSDTWETFLNKRMPVFDDENHSTVFITPLQYALVQTCLPLTAAALINQGASLHGMDPFKPQDPQQKPGPNFQTGNQHGPTPNLERLIFVPGNDLWLGVDPAS